MTDGQYLKAIRKQLGLNQTEMAEKMGYSSQQMVSFIETGERNLGGTARKLLEYIEKYDT